jgi:hypothetical protein
MGYKYEMEVSKCEEGYQYNVCKSGMWIKAFDNFEEAEDFVYSFDEKMTRSGYIGNTTYYRDIDSAPVYSITLEHK